MARTSSAAVSPAQAARLFVGLLLLTDVLMGALAFNLAYVLRVSVPFPEPAQGVRPFTDFLPMLFIHVSALVAGFVFADLYRLHRASRVDEFSSIVVGSTVGTLMGIALDSLLLRGLVADRDYPRVMMLYAWLLSVLLVTLGASACLRDRYRRYRPHDPAEDPLDSRTGV